MKLRGIIALAFALACTPALAQISPGTSPQSVAKGGTGRSSFTSNLPVIGNGTGALALGTRSGNTTQFITGTSPQSASSCISFDASGNLTTVAAACQSGTFTPTNASPSTQTIQAQLQKIPVSCEDYSGGCTAANIAQAMSDAAANGRCFQFNGNYTIAASVALAAPAGILCITGRGGLVGSSGMNGPLLDIKNSNNGVYIDRGLSFDCASVLSIPAAIKVWTDGAGGTQNTNINGPVIVRCRRGIQFGDPAYTDFIVDGNYMQGGGYTFNVAQPVAMYSSQSGLFVDNFMNHADNSNLSSTFTGTCSGTTLTAASVIGYLAKDDVLTGTGITTTGTYITVQLTGAPGGAGTYTVSSSCTSSSAALTAKPASINYLVVGGALHVRNGNVQNTVVGGKMFVVRPVNSATFGFPYGRPSIMGSTIEGADIIFTSDPDGVGTPGSGAFYMNGVQGDFSQNTNCYITTDSAFTGTISALGGRLFSTTPRSVGNICPGNSAVKVNIDPETFGSNMVQGFAGITGGVKSIIPYASPSTTLQTSIGAPTGTASATGVMMGMGSTCKITPASTGRVQVWFVGSQADSAASWTHTVNVRYGTGTAPANAAAITGTAVLGNSNSNTVISSSGVVTSFNIGGIASGLSIGTPYWFDMNLATGSGGTGSLSNMNCSIVEF
ncbi:hypothetical protein IVB12_15220 [Bradyrhizobium sp. 179]|uniref:hypothetical protein n=1 Tax=Bradyrhizobium sp. 179 TaxID=2782648 RepID=UPI001FF95D8A|nr:hypothetical protein [Bradyrhizobium sp. 179]MCK1543265.1 hypothetical protein [Bradyrhizobium sp. 179]